MQEHSILPSLETAGYRLLPPHHETSFGHSGLMVLLRQSSAETLFDAKSIRLKVLNWDQTVHWTTIEAESPFHEARKLCPGKVVVGSRTGDEASFFVFGGTLQATSLRGETLYSLHSSAPILGLTIQPDSIDSQLATDAEVILAEEFARQRRDDQAFWQSLMKLNPFQLYVTCIKQILNRYQQSAALRQTHPHYYASLKKEREWLTQAGTWLETVPTLVELLT